MANRRLPMRKIKEILRLYFQARLSARQIARSCSVSRATVGDYLSRTHRQIQPDGLGPDRRFSKMVSKLQCPGRRSFALLAAQSSGVLDGTARRTDQRSDLDFGH